MEKRRHQRIKVTNLVADLSDGLGFFSGTVCDISRYGMLLDDLPKKLNNQTNKLTVVVSANGKYFKIQAMPKWVNENNQNKSIGVEIIKAPPGWSDFVRKHEPKKIDEDVWAAAPVA